jgi:transcriptional regulator with XRE-family HTH domain
MDIQLKIGKRVKELRIEKKLSQEALAIDANVERAYVSHLESGRRNISIKNMEKILDALGVSFAEFFGDKTFK